MAELKLDTAPSVSNHFAWLRTQMAMQRTQMAAVRTSVSLIGFGFTVAQFFQRLVSGATEAQSRLGPEVPRQFGMILIGAGVISLAVFTWEYHQATRYMRSEAFQQIADPARRPMHTSTYLVSFVVILIGVAAFVSVFARF